MKVSVFGAPGCGRTVFLGLLYETLIRMSTEGDEPEVIMNVGPVEAKAFGDVRLDLMSGRWPSAETGRKLSGRSVELGFVRGRSLFRSRGLVKVRLEDVPLTERDLQVVKASGQLREVISGSSGGSIDRYGLGEMFRDALGSEALILLADVSEPREGTWPREERDAFLATLVENIARTRLGKERKVHITVVLTKAEPAEADGERVFETAYPRTAKAVHKADELSPIFISWLRTVPDTDREQVPSALRRDGQVQIDYADEEYRRLVQNIGRIS